MEGLPLKTTVALFSGLGANSRTVMRLTGRELTTEETLLAGIADRLSVLIWQNAGGKPEDKPNFILKNGEERKAKGVKSFRTAEDFMKARETFFQKRG